MYGTDSCTVYAAWRHAQRANFLFVDGHVSLLDFNRLPKYGAVESWTHYYVGQTY